MRKPGPVWCAVLAGAVLVGGACGGDDDADEASTAEAAGADRESSAKSEEISSAPEGVPAAAAFRAVYRNEDTAGAEARLTTETLQVRRPYEVRLEARSGPPPGTELVRTAVVNRDYRYELTGEKVLSAVPRWPSSPTEIVSATALAAAAEAGVAERIGEATVAGEPCTTYAYRQTATTPMSPPTAEERTESCVTPDGILLKRTTTLAGRRIGLLEALEVTRNPELAADLFLTGQTPDPKIVAISGYGDGVSILSENKAPDGTTPAVVAIPEGFTAGRKVGLNRETGIGASRVFYVESFERGADLLMAEQILSGTGEAPWPAAEGKAVEVDGSPGARIAFWPGYVEVRLSGKRPGRTNGPTTAAALTLARSVVAA